MNYKTYPQKAPRRPQALSEDVFRANIYRQSSFFEDFILNIAVTFKTYKKIVDYTSAFASRNSSNPMFFVAKEVVDEAIGKNPYGMNSTMYRHMIQSVESFFKENGQHRRLITADPLVQCSFQASSELFEIETLKKNNWPKHYHWLNTKEKVSSVSKISIIGLEPFYIHNVKTKNIKHLVVRPKIGMSGVHNLQKWECLFFLKNYRYKIDQTDSNRNTKYLGRI